MKKIFVFAMALCIYTLLLSSCATKQNVMKVEFMAEPCLIPTASGKWKLCDNMIVHVDDTYHVVPRGFKTDLASVPRLLWSLYSPIDFNSIASGVLHDWHYCCQPNITRKQADLIFYYGLREHGMSKGRSSLYYYVVRSWGWLFYSGGEGFKYHLSEFDEGELQGVYNDVNYKLE